MEIKEKSDEELFRNLRTSTLTTGMVMVMVSVVTIFTKYLGEYWYRTILLFSGLLLVSYSSQKFLQEHPKFRNVLIVSLSGVTLLGVMVLFIIERLKGLR